MNIKVMMADDHLLCREGIKQLLEFDGSIDVIKEVSDGEECLKVLEHTIPQILLLDINMPKMNGLEVLKVIRKKKYPIKVLILTVHDEIEYLMKAMDIGVDGYLSKSASLTELKKAITCVMNNETYIQPNLIPMLNNRLIHRNEDGNKLKTLTRREKEILICIANGKVNKEIAMDLDISERTVKNHISNLFKKINVNDRTQAAVFAIKNDLIKLY